MQKQRSLKFFTMNITIAHMVLVHQQAVETLDTLHLETATFMRKQH